jgi:hypothetical protein
MKTLLMGIALASLALVSCKNTSMSVEASEAPMVCPMSGGDCVGEDECDMKASCDMEGMDMSQCEGMKAESCCDAGAGDCCDEEAGSNN